MSSKQVIQAFIVLLFILTPLAQATTSTDSSSSLGSIFSFFSKILQLQAISDGHLNDYCLYTEENSCYQITSVYMGCRSGQYYSTQTQCQNALGTTPTKQYWCVKGTSCTGPYTSIDAAVINCNSNSDYWYTQNDCISSITVRCGDGIASASENCHNCPSDVPCSGSNKQCTVRSGAWQCVTLKGLGEQCGAGQECLSGNCGGIGGVCVSDVCGNTLREPNEDCHNCPTDIQCASGTRCLQHNSGIWTCTGCLSDSDCGTDQQCELARCVAKEVPKPTPTTTCTEAASTQGYEGHCVYNSGFLGIGKGCDITAFGYVQSTFGLQSTNAFMPDALSWNYTKTPTTNLNLGEGYGDCASATLKTVSGEIAYTNGICCGYKQAESINGGDTASPQRCGNGVCDVFYREDCSNCQKDCGTCQTVTPEGTIPFSETKRITFNINELNEKTSTQLLSGVCSLDEQCINPTNQTITPECRSITSLREDGYITDIKESSILDEGRTVFVTTATGSAIGGILGIGACALSIAATPLSLGASIPFIVGTCGTVGALLGGGVGLGVSSVQIALDKDDPLLAGFKESDPAKVGLCVYKEEGISQTFDSITKGFNNFLRKQGVTGEWVWAVYAGIALLVLLFAFGGRR